MIAQLDDLYIKKRPLKALNRLISYFFFEGRPITTKGRFINTIIMLCLKLLFRLPILKEVKKPIFIIGIGRSGTTILGKILSIHKEVGYLNEPKLLWHLIHDNEDLIGSYSHGNAQYRLDEYDVKPKSAINAKKIYGAYLRFLCVQRVVDKYPELIFRIPFIKSIFHDSKFIFLSRNGLDTIASIQNWSKEKGINNNKERHDWWGRNGRKWNFLVDQIAYYDNEINPFIEEIKAFTDQKHMATVEWILSMKEGLSIKNLYSEDVFWLRYEDLIDNPLIKINELLNFLELSSDPVLIDYALKMLKTPRKHSFTNIPDSLRNLFHNISYELGYDYKKE